MPRPTKVGLFYSGRGLKLRKYNHLGEKGELGKRNVAVLDRRKRGGGKVGRERKKRGEKKEGEGRRSSGRKGGGECRR